MNYAPQNVGLVPDICNFSRHSREFFDAPRALVKPSLSLDEEESAKIALSSAPLSVLFMSSLKEVSRSRIEFISSLY